MQCSIGQLFIFFSFSNILMLSLFQGVSCEMLRAPDPDLEVLASQIIGMRQRHGGQTRPGHCGTRGTGPAGTRSSGSAQ